MEKSTFFSIFPLSLLPFFQRVALKSMYLKIKDIVLSALSLAFVWGCTNSESPVPDEVVYDPPSAVVPDSLEGMMQVKAVGTTVTLGTDKNVRSIDRPAMQVNFDYDFSMGRHEVTCGEFNALMKSSIGLALDCENDDLPATDITFYDAVLFANERSKAEHYDTAYTYVGATFDSHKHCTNMEGFALRTEADAYRLPTEAEWVLVANSVWNVKNAWTAENSEYTLHEVCGKAEEGEFCDMVGNAMEWVNDWLGEYSSKNFKNFVGASDGGALGQRIVKGGSYRNEAASIALYTRGDVYAVSSSTRADYVGFRLAFGTIPDPTWLGHDGSGSESRVVALANSSTIRTLTGTYRSKLVFRNDITGKLSYIDYSSGELSVVELSGTNGAYHPDISPDGKFVAYCTGVEGISGKSSVYVRALRANADSIPVKLDVESAVIPRWRVLANGDTAIVYVSDAGNNKESSDFLAMSTWQVVFKDGEFGNPEKLFDGAYHGGISADGTLSVTGSKSLRARIADASTARDTVWYGGEQACNASLSKDSSKRTLFLDFGGENGQKFVGKKYNTHERLLIADSAGNLVQSVAAPAGYTFDHSEWVGSSFSDIAVVTLADMNGAHGKIAVVSLKDSSVVEIAEGEELWHPALWAMSGISSSEDAFLDPDSAGVYLTPGLSVWFQVLRPKMELFWNHFDELEYFLVGSSRVEDGLIPDSIKAGYSLNMGHPFNSMDMSFYLAENYAINHAANLKAVVFSLDFDLWYDFGDVVQAIVEGAPGYLYDAHHDFWKSGVPDAFVERVNESYPSTESYMSLYTASRGYNSCPYISWGDPLVELDSNWMDLYPYPQSWQINRMRRFLENMESRGIYVVAVIFPQNPRYRETGSWGRYGPRRSEIPAILDSLNALLAEFGNFRLMNENKMGDHDYPDSMAMNTDHLAFPGAVQITRRLDSLLKTLK